VSALLNGSIDTDSLSSFNLAPEQKIIVEGSTATMRTGAGEAFTLWKQEATLMVGETTETFAPDDAFSLMVQDVSAAIRGEDSQVFPSVSSLRVAEILDTIRAQ
jgi:hypothetical protein